MESFPETYNDPTRLYHHDYLFLIPSRLGLIDCQAITKSMRSLFRSDIGYASVSYLIQLSFTKNIWYIKKVSTFHHSNR